MDSREKMQQVFRSIAPNRNEHIELTRLREIERLAWELAVEAEPYISGIPKLRDKARTLKAKIEERK